MKVINWILLIVILLSNYSYAQYIPKNKKNQFYGNQRLHKPLYRWVTGDYNRHGIQLSFGPTYTFTKIGEENQELRIQSATPSQDTLILFSHEAKGRIGIFGEVGMVHITKRPRKLVHYYDWGIGFKLFGGRELSESEIYDNRDTLIGV